MKRGWIKIVGLSGGIGSGKSAVARMFQRLGAKVVDADAIAHDVLNQPGIIQKIAHRWGDKVLGKRGGIDRKKLGRLAFRDEESLNALQKIVHPAILREIRARTKSAARRGGGETLVLDAPLLHETKLDAICDEIVYIHARRDVRSRRIGKVRRWGSQEIRRREAFQMPLSQKRCLADYVVDNTGPRRETFRQVKELWKNHLGAK